MTMPRISPVRSALGFQDGTDLVCAFDGLSLLSYSIVNLNVQGPGNKTLNLYVGTRDIGGLRDSTQVSSNNTATYPPGQIIVNPGQQVYVVWINGAPYSGLVLATLTATE